MVPPLSTLVQRGLLRYVITIVIVIVILIAVAIIASRYLVRCGDDQIEGDSSLLSVKAQHDAQSEAARAQYERRIADLEAEVAAIRDEIARIDREIIESVAIREEAHDALDDADDIDAIDAIIYER